MALRSAVMLIASDRDVATDALGHAQEFLEVRQVLWHRRDQKRLLDPLVPADYLLNFLSSPKVPLEELVRFRTPINFHPAPPEYPGVGSASLALYDHKAWHGVTAHLMDGRFDHGTVLRVRRFPIDPAWGYEALFDRSLRECLALFVEMVRDIAAGLPLRTSTERWARRAYTRREFESHPAFEEVPA